MDRFIKKYQTYVDNLITKYNEMVDLNWRHELVFGKIPMDRTEIYKICLDRNGLYVTQEEADEFEMVKLHTDINNPTDWYIIPRGHKLRDSLKIYFI